MANPHFRLDYIRNVRIAIQSRSAIYIVYMYTFNIQQAKRYNNKCGCCESSAFVVRFDEEMDRKLLMFACSDVTPQLMLYRLSVFVLYVYKQF